MCVTFCLWLPSFTHTVTEGTATATLLPSMSRVRADTFQRLPHPPGVALWALEGPCNPALSHYVDDFSGSSVLCTELSLSLTVSGENATLWGPGTMPLSSVCVVCMSGCQSVRLSVY